MTTLQRIEKQTKDTYVKLLQFHDETAEQEDRKFAVEIYLHTSDNLIATIWSDMRYKSDMVFDALMRNYL